MLLGNDLFTLAVLRPRKLFHKVLNIGSCGGSSKDEILLDVDQALQIIQHVPNVNAEMVSTITTVLCSIASVKTQLWTYVDEHLLDTESISWKSVESSRKILYVFVDLVSKTHFSKQISDRSCVSCLCSDGIE